MMSPDIGMLNDRTIYDNIALALLAVDRPDKEIRSTTVIPL